MRLTHVINPFRPPDASPAASAQRAAVKSIELAVRTARSIDNAPPLDIRVVAVAAPEDRPAAPPFADDFVPLDRALPDVVDIRPCRTLPLIQDLLRLGAAAIDAPSDDDDLLIYTNSDIGLTPTFYALVARLAREAPAFAIRRRNIDAAITDPTELPLMLAQIGEAHEGTDCFVMPRSVAADIDLGCVAIALPGIEHAVLCAVDAAVGHASKSFRNLHATFHHGDDRVWERDDELSAFNRAEAARVVAELARTHPNHPAGGVFDTEQSKLNVQRPKTKSVGYKLRRALGLAPDRRWAEPFGRPR